VRALTLAVLDLDGTIYSSRATTLGAVERAVRDLNARHGLALPVPTEDEILAGVGSTRQEFAARVFPALPLRYHSEIDALVWHWEHALITSGRGSLFPGARAALEELARDGFRLAMATNAGQGYMDAILDHFDLRAFFEKCLCAGAGGGDKADLIRSIVTSLDVPPDATAMVGDRKSDVDAATKAGARSVGCAWGFGTPEELAGADRIVRSFEELPPLMRAWL